MKSLYYCKTNAEDILISYDSDLKIVRYLWDYGENEIHQFKDHLEKVEDDSSWEIIEDVEDIEKYFENEDLEVVATLENANC